MKRLAIPLLVMVLLGGIIAWQHHAHKDTEEKLTQTRTQLERLQKNLSFSSKASREANNKITAFNNKTETYKSKFNAIKKNHPDPGACRVPADRLRLLREAIRESNTATP